MPGRELFALGAGEWDIPSLRSLRSATASGDAKVDAYDMDLVRPGKTTRRLVLNLRKLEYADPRGVRMLLTIADETETRLRDKKNTDLVRENETLLQEVRHRVANSLQIIASVLMQSARRTQSDEARTHLTNAHSRVMSVAALQQQLAASTLGSVELKAYLTKLCETIAASMIADPKLLSIEVAGRDAVIEAGTSVSLGLIVTELTINALKHGFPEGRGGKIRVEFDVTGPNWILSVSDTGVGMPKGPKAPAGLGTNIVEALARQLHARIEVVDQTPGTKVSIIHSAIGTQGYDAGLAGEKVAV